MWFLAAVYAMPPRVFIPLSKLPPTLMAALPRSDWPPKGEVEGEVWAEGPEPREGEVDRDGGEA